MVCAQRLMPPSNKSHQKHDRFASSSGALHDRGDRFISWAGRCDLPDGAGADWRDAHLRRIAGLFPGACVFSLATFAAFAYKRAGGLLTLLVAAMFLVTLWLLYVQAFVLHAYCRYCLFSAAITFLLAGLVIAIPPSRPDCI
ncbi:MAG: hypothetical protein DME50_03925 [Verrucomicrobia bacterium]|nr:MAG: hypothetical protein DME50_03925 [Verrucomicrobiota bacterium]